MTAKNAAPQRPLSPFMLGKYYRFQITSLLSITHRLTGVALAVGTLFVTAWIMSAAIGPESYGGFQYYARSWVGQIVMIGWTWALFFHLCNGIRHLVWDTGRGFELKNVYIGGWLVILGSIALTASVWLLACNG